MSAARLLAASLVVGALGTANVLAQSGHVGPSVLTPQQSYHFGAFSTQVEVPSGALRLGAKRGTVDLSGNLGVSVTFDSYEFTPTSASVASGPPIPATYHVLPDGQVVLDFDPTNPGTDTIGFYIAADPVAMHSTRHELDTEAETRVALAKSSGMSAASLAGAYHFYAEHLEFRAAGFETSSAWGTMSFDGVGTATYSGTEMTVDATGTVATSPISGTVPYAVAPDGALSMAVDQGGVAANGELFFAVGAELSSKEVGIVLGVKIGASYDHQDLVGRYSISGRSHGVGPLPNQVRTTTDYGIATLAATGATTGTMALEAISVTGTAQGVTLQSHSVSGTSSLAPNGLMTLTDPGGSVELAFSADGRYCVGRSHEPHTNLIFGMRQANECEVYGTGTAGTGSLTPELGMRTFPTLGNAAWRFAVIEGLGGAAAILPIGFADSPAIPFRGGTLWIDPLAVVAAPFVVLGGSAGVAGAGAVDVGLAIPSFPGLNGVELFAQALVLDPAAPGSAAMSNGFHVRLGP